MSRAVTEPACAFSVYLSSQFAHYIYSGNIQVPLKPRLDGVESLLVDPRPELVLEVAVPALGDLHPAVDGDAAGPLLPAGDVRRVAPHREDLHAVELDVELRKVR